MLLPAHIDLTSIQAPRIPPEVSARAWEYDIEVSAEGLADAGGVWGTAVWISCRSAWPHQDPSYSGKRFLTLAIEADHEYCEASGPNYTSLNVRPGILFATDPMNLHWLRQNNPDTSVGFVGIQWEIPAESFDAELQRIFSELGSTCKSVVSSTECLRVSEKPPMELNPA